MSILNAGLKGIQLYDVYDEEMKIGQVYLLRDRTELWECIKYSRLLENGFRLFHDEPFKTAVMEGGVIEVTLFFSDYTKKYKLIPTNALDVRVLTQRDVHELVRFYYHGPEEFLRVVHPAGESAYGLHGRLPFKTRIAWSERDIIWMVKFAVTEEAGTRVLRATLHAKNAVNRRFDKIEHKSIEVPLNLDENYGEIHIADRLYNVYHEPAK